MADISGLIKDVAAKQESRVPPDIDAERESNKLFGASKREDRYQASRHWVLIIAVWAVGLTITATLVVRIAILVLPSNYRWLTDEQLHGYDQVVLSGTLGGLLTQFSRHVNKPSKRRR